MQATACQASDYTLFLPFFLTIPDPGLENGCFRQILYVDVRNMVLLVYFEQYRLIRFKFKFNWNVFFMAKNIHHVSFFGGIQGLTILKGEFQILGFGICKENIQFILINPAPTVKSLCSVNERPDIAHFSPFPFHIV